MPGSGQWYEASNEAVPNKHHSKCECWICAAHIYSVLLWSRGKAYVMNPVMTPEEAEGLRYEIDKIDNEYVPTPRFRTPEVRH